MGVATIDGMGGRLRFSVGIPTRNQAATLPATLESLLHQTRRPDEIVVSDHGSTDDTPEILREFAKLHPGLIRIVSPPAGSNLTGQYNFTLTSQTGDWITLLSSDDLARSNYVHAMMHAAESVSGAALVRGAWENIDGADNVLSHEYLLSVPPVQEAPHTLISQRNGPKVSFAAFAVRREAYLASGPILSAMESLADWALFAQLTPFGPFVTVKEILSGYRVGHDGNKFRNRCGMWIRDERRMFAEVLPTAAERLNMRDRAWIAQASRANFQRYLAAASREFRPEERSSLLPDFAPWAESVGALQQLETFAAGGSVKQSITAMDVARQLLRPLAQRLTHRFSRRS